MATSKRLFNLLLSPAEALQLGARAKKAGVSKSEYVRRLIAAPTDSPDPWIQGLVLAEQKFLADARLLNYLGRLSPKPKKDNLGASDLEAILGIVESNQGTLAMKAAFLAEQRPIAEVVLGIAPDAWRDPARRSRRSRSARTSGGSYAAADVGPARS